MKCRQCHKEIGRWCYRIGRHPYCIRCADKRLPDGETVYQSSRWYKLAHGTYTRAWRV